MGWKAVILRVLFYGVGCEHDVNGMEKGVIEACFTEACMVLCFGSVIKTVDKTEMFRLFLRSADTESRPSLPLTPPHQ